MFPLNLTFMISNHLRFLVIFKDFRLDKSIRKYHGNGFELVSSKLLTHSIFMGWFDGNWEGILIPLGDWMMRFWGDFEVFEASDILVFSHQAWVVKTVKRALLSLIKLKIPIHPKTLSKLMISWIIFKQKLLNFPIINYKLNSNCINNNFWYDLGNSYR
jgi:hypothetical protein